MERAALSREQILEHHVESGRCICTAEGHCHTLMKEILRNNGLDGAFQEAILGALRAGRAKQRNICLLGPSDCGKSFLLKGLRGLFQVYERPDGGSYQLEDLLGAEVLFLNDFEYDTGAKDWMPWAYFKDFLEGSKVKVAVPKSRGGNQVFNGDAPVFLTAPEEVTLKKQGREVMSETLQMRRRIRYFTLHWEIPQDRRQEVVEVCSHCAARIYLEGKSVPSRPATSSSVVASEVGAVSASSASGPPAKKPRTAADAAKELTQLGVLVGEGLLSREEFTVLKQKLLSEL